MGAIGFIVIGGLSTAYALFGGGPAALGLGLLGITFLIVGGVYLLVTKFLGGLDPANVVSSGGVPPIPGTAQVLWTRDTGVVLNNVNLVVKLGLSVTAGGKQPYEAETRHVLEGRQQWAAIQPGMTVPVLVNATDPSKVVIDTQRPVVSSHGAPPTTVGGGARVEVKSNAELVATGVKSTGTLQHVTPTGMTAGQAKLGLPAEIADDPVMHVVFTYVGPENNELRAEIMVRVPDGNGHLLIVGTTIPVSYQPGSPESVTIDWDLMS